MNTPGFTAHQSLYLSNRHYITGFIATWNLPGTVMPEFDVPKNGGGDCHESCGACSKACKTSCQNTCLPVPYDKSCCASTESCCDGECIDTDSHSANCGACGHSCPSGQVCNHGECGCRSGLTLCNGKCVDLNSDHWNCGACGHECSNLPCTDGKCRCPSGLTRCGDVCVDLYLDKSNCGACGVACKNGERCCVGTCGGTPCGTGCCPKGMPCCDTAVGLRCCSNLCIHVPFGLKDICI